MFDCCEICRGLIGSDAAFVVAENHIHDPMQTILDRPVTPHDGSKAVGRQGQRGDVEPCLALDLVVDVTQAVDDDDAVQTGPLMARSQPADIVDGGRGSCLDVAMIGIDGFIAADRGVLEIAGFLLGGENLDILAQRARLAFNART